MTSEQPGRDAADVGFAERLLEVIDSGRRTATCKLAVLIAVMDLCARNGDAAGRAPGCCIPGTSPSRWPGSTGRK